jgi:hypothetical protein
MCQSVDSDRVTARLPELAAFRTLLSLVAADTFVETARSVWLGNQNVAPGFLEHPQRHAAQKGLANEASAMWSYCQQVDSAGPRQTDQDWTGVPF